MKTTALRMPASVTGDNSQELKRIILELLNDRPGLLLLDMGGVTYMNTAGMAVLVYAFTQAMAAGVTVRLHRPQDHVRELIQRSRFDQIIPIVDGPAGA